ncbi:unnamed protein product [Mucor fragilis]
MSLTTTLNTSKIAQSQQDFYPKVQPRSSAERDNSILLHSALKAASTDMAHKLLDYASLDKTDCEASCILIALANHEPLVSRSNKSVESNGETSGPKQDKINHQNVSSKQASQGVTQTNDKKSQQKNDPIMLLMAAAEVVNRQSQSDEKRKRHSYPSRYYHRRSDEWTPQHKRMRTSPPTSPAPTYKPDTWRKNSSRSLSKSDHTSSTKVAQANNSFSRQYHSMKQNPKIKQNALHTYITYMIYNDLAHGGGTNQAGKQMPWRPLHWQMVQSRKIMDRPMCLIRWAATCLPPLLPLLPHRQTTTSKQSREMSIFIIALMQEMHCTIAQVVAVACDQCLPHLQMSTTIPS